MKIVKLVFAFALIRMLMAGTHPFYVSTTEIEYIAKSKEVGIAFKTFPDDLEETIRIFAGKKIDLSSKSKAENNQLISAYLQQHLSIDINRSKKELNFLGYEIDKEAIWIYFNIPKINSIKEMKITSDVMYEYKPEQTNIIHVNLKGNTSSYKLNSPNKEVVINN
jgi:hypothetical protein